MTFGQQSGPPASAKQMQYLLSLLKKAGHEGFRDARGALGLSQRQGNGKFTTREASDLIAQLLGGDDDGDDGPPHDQEPVASPRAAKPATAREPAPTSPLAGFPAPVLAAELERRGWTVTPPG